MHAFYPRGYQKPLLIRYVTARNITSSCGKNENPITDVVPDFCDVTQRRGRAGRVQPGACYRLYPRVIHDAMPQFQLPEILRTPLQELCLTIKSLQLGAVASFLAKALQPPDPLSVKNAIELLKTIGALDDMEELTSLGLKFCCYLA